MLDSSTRSHTLTRCGPRFYHLTPWSHHSAPEPPWIAQVIRILMLFSFLIASVSTGPTSTTSIGPSPTNINITNRCGIDGAVDHEFLVTLKPAAASSDGRRLDTTEDKLSFLQGWVDQYTVDQHDSEGTYSNGTTRRKLEHNSTHVSNATHILHFFTVTQLAVAVGASDEVRRAHAARAHTARAHVESTRAPRVALYLTYGPLCTCTCTCAPHQTIALMAEDPAVGSIECDCLERADMSLPQGNDPFPSDPGTPDLDEAVARRLTVHDRAPWGIDRIDTNGEPPLEELAASTQPSLLIATQRASARACCDRQAARSTASTTTATLEVKVCVFTSWTRASRTRTSTSEVAWSTGTR